jgi:hypothetical protein
MICARMSRGAARPAIPTRIAMLTTSRHRYRLKNEFESVDPIRRDTVIDTL